MSGPAFSFVIVTYNSGETIEACLSSIAAFTHETHEIVIIDNSPDPSTMEAIGRYKVAHRLQLIRVINPGMNIGFGRACNVGAQHSTGKYLFFLNPDTQLMNNAAVLLAHCIEENPGTLAAGPAILDAQGKVTRTCRNLPSLGRIVLDATGIDTWCGSYKLTRFRHDQPRLVEQIIGAAILMRRIDYESIGGMDERFFVYFEEVDLCKRLQAAGGLIWFWPDALVQHLAGRSCEVGLVHARMIFTLRESRRKYFLKHFGVVYGWILEGINRVEAIAKSAVFFLLLLLRRERVYWIKAYGFLSVVAGIAPRV